MDEIFKNLNKDQIEGALATEGKVRAIAGAGTGKTKTLVSRYAHIVKNLGVNPSNILCITFTNKAAKEMKERVCKLINMDFSNEYICTIHSICRKIVSDGSYIFNINKNVPIDDDPTSLAKKVLKELNLEDEISKEQFLKDIAEYKAKTPYINDIILNKDIVDSDEPILNYILRQRREEILDFDDLLYFSVFLLKNYKSIREKWSFFQYIMVDEAQDCNKIDWELVDLLSSTNKNVFCVGDDCQSIYAFRGSRPDMFINFKSQKDIVLNQNYRSTTEILNVANSIIGHNEKQIKKTLYTKNKNGEKPVFYHADDDKAEAAWIVNEIKRLKEEENRKNSDFAILYRSSYLSRAIEEQLLKNNISYIIWGGTRFFDRKEIKDVMAYLKLIEYGNDLSFERIINFPSRKFGNASTNRLKFLSEKENSTLYETLKKHINDKEFNKRPLIDFINLIEYCRKNKDELGISSIINYVIVKGGLDKEYLKDTDEERHQNISELIFSASEYEKANEHEEDLSLGKYLTDMSLYTTLDKKETGDMLKLSTVHQSKGLEFPIVFVCGLNERVFPSIKTIKESGKDGLEEERRIFYVAVTRAKEKLYLSDSGGFSHISKDCKEPSRFIYEIGDELLNIVKPIKEEKKESFKLRFNKKNSGDISVGDSVEHYYFGVGKVISYNEKNYTYNVKFNIGIRTLVGGVLKKV